MSGQKVWNQIQKAWFSLHTGQPGMVCGQENAPFLLLPATTSPRKQTGFKRTFLIEQGHSDIQEHFAPGNLGTPNPA